MLHILDKVDYRVYSSWIDKTYIAARVCYSNKSIKELQVEAFTKPLEEKEKFLEERVFKPGHWSVLEHASITFAFENVSRAMTHQLVRHRHLSYSQKSQRYASAKSVDLVLPFEPDEKAKIKGLVENYIKELEKLKSNLELLGLKVEDIRYFYPNSFATTIVVTGNLRALLEVMNLRLCSRAQKEIRQCFFELKQELVKLLPPTNIITKYMVPKCAICTEKEDCEK